MTPVKRSIINYPSLNLSFLEDITHYVGDYIANDSRDYIREQHLPIFAEYYHLLPFLRRQDSRQAADLYENIMIAFEYYGYNEDMMLKYIKNQ